LIPGKIVSKAGFDDLGSGYFKAVYDCKKLAATLTDDWQMADPSIVLPPCVEVGRSKSHFSTGFWSGQPSPDRSANVKWIKDNGHHGVIVMTHTFQDAANQKMTSELVYLLYGSGISQSRQQKFRIFSERFPKRFSASETKIVTFLNHFRIMFVIDGKTSSEVGCEQFLSGFASQDSQKYVARLKVE
jgi:hypothetical protein